MKSIYIRVIVLTSILLPVFGVFSVCAGGEDTRKFRQAQESARSGNIDFAYMNYRAILNSYPDSQYRSEALFAGGEYHYSLPMYPKAEAAFKTYLSEFPDHEGRLFAMALLMQTLRQLNKNVEADQLKQDIIKFKQVSLVFRDFKEYIYASPLGRAYKAIFHIDTIDFYVGDRVFAQISF